MIIVVIYSFYFIDIIIVKNMYVFFCEIIDDRNFYFCFVKNVVNCLVVINVFSIELLCMLLFVIKVLLVEGLIDREVV